MQELCSVYAVRPKSPGSSGQPIDAMSMFRKERQQHKGTAVPGGSTGELSYFVLHNPMSHVTSQFIARGMCQAPKRRTKKQTDLYGGLCEKDRFEASRKAEESGGHKSSSRRRSSSSTSHDSGSSEASSSTVPSVALIIAVELPHRSRALSKSTQKAPGVSEGAEAPGEQDSHGGREEEKNEQGAAKGQSKTRSSGVETSSKKAVSGNVSGISVGGFCRWRGCLRKGVKVPIMASGKTSKHILCGLHVILRSFLEGCGAKDELARHLPSLKKMKAVLASRKKKGSDTSVEFLRITATSALLQELLGGKLAATIRAFCRRAAADARSLPSGKGGKQKGQARQESTRRDPDAMAKVLQRTQRQLHQLKRDLNLSKEVHKTEEAVAGELRRLCALGVFPDAELRSIRQTYNELDHERARLLAEESKSGGPGSRSDAGVGAEDQGGKPRDDAANRLRSEGELELEFCRRKLSILSGRRQQLEVAEAERVSLALAETLDPQIVMDGKGFPTTLKGSQSSDALTAAAQRAAEQEVQRAGSMSSLLDKPAPKSQQRIDDARQFSRNHYQSGDKPGRRQKAR